MRKTSPTIATCVIYARYSTDQQNPLSCADQIAECIEHAERRGWRVVAIESDEAVRAGADIAMRGGLQRAIARIKEGGVDALFVHELSRFSRGFYDAFGILNELRRDLRYVVGLDLGALDLHDTEGTRRLVDGVIPTLVALMRARQTEVDALDRQISAGEAELKPLLVPRGIEEFVDGDAHLIDDEVAARRRVSEDVRKIVVHPDGAIVLYFSPESFFELTSYGFDLDDQDETTNLRELRERHMVAASRVEGGRDPFAIEDGGSILYGATVKMPPGFRLDQEVSLRTRTRPKRSQRPQRDSNPESPGHRA